MISKKELKEIIDKINNRCNPQEYESFDHLLDELDKTTNNGDPTFLSEYEIKLIQSNPNIEENILKMCIMVLESITIDYSNTLSRILTELDLLFNTEMVVDKQKYYLEHKKNLQFLLLPSSITIKDTIEEVLVMLDMSVIPYR
jgi:hypothetical protein